MRLSKKFAAIAITATVAVTATAAFGWWSSSGTGEGSVSSGTSSAFAVSSEEAVGDDLAPITAAEALEPGAPVQTVAFSVTNNNAGHQHIASIEVTVADETGGAWSVPAVNGEGCSAADFVVEGYDQAPDADLAPDATYEDTITIYMVNGNADQDDCKGLSSVPLFIDVK